MAVEPLREWDPPVVGAYRLRGRLGSGGMGQVFLGQGPDGRLVAVKTVHEHLAAEARSRQRFQAEVQTAQRVSGVWTARVLDFDTESSIPWVATEYVAGAPLQTAVDSPYGPLGERPVWRLAFGLGQALKTIHDAGLIHRDLKPANVLVSRDGLKVIDFGITRAVDMSLGLTGTGQILGTPGYMAPEQIRAERLTGAADVFALGAVLTYAATGHPPFTWDGPGLHTALHRGTSVPPRLGPEEGPLRGDLRSLVVRCLAKEAAQRPSLSEIILQSQARMGTGEWLPADLADWLDGQTPTLPQDLTVHLQPHTPLLPPQPGGYGAPPHGSGPPPGGPGAVAPGAPTTPPQPSLFQPPPQRRSWPGRLRSRYVLGAVSAVVVLSLGGWLLAKTLPLGPDEPPKDHAQSPSPAHAPLADVVPDSLREAGVLTVHVADKQSVMLRVRNGTATGFEVDLVRAMARKLGVHVRFVPEPDDGDTARAAVEKGREVAAHIAMADLPDSSDRREEWGVDMVDHYWSGLAVISAGKHQDMAEMCGLKLVTYPDEDLQKDIREEAGCKGKLDLRPVDDGTDDMVAAVRSGKADAAVLQYPPAATAGYEKKTTGLVVSLLEDGRGPRGIAVPRGQQALLDAVTEALKAVVKDGTYRKLLERWYLRDATISRVQTNVGG